MLLLLVTALICFGNFHVLEKIFQDTHHGFWKLFSNTDHVNQNILGRSKLFSLGISGLLELCDDSGSKSKQFHWTSIDYDVDTCKFQTQIWIHSLRSKKSLLKVDFMNMLFHYSL